MTLQELKEETCRRLNISFDDVRAGTEDLIKWNDLQSWANLAVLRVWDYARWTFSEKAYTTSTVANTAALGAGEYYDYPNDFQPDSIELLRVTGSDGKYDTYKKIRYLDYIKYREENENGDEKLWTDHNRYYFVNPKAWSSVAGRTIEVHGKIRATNLTDSTAALPFSPDSDNEENSGNEAIVKIAKAYALESEKYKNYKQAQIEKQDAFAILDSLKKREEEEQVTYQTQDRPLFDSPPIIGNDFGGSSGLPGSGSRDVW